MISTATPPGLEQRLLTRARAASFARGDRLVVGFSGGRDSLALAAALRRVAAVIGIEPLLVHVDHRLRDRSAVEARRAVEHAAALGMECQVVVLGPWPPRVTAGSGLEEAAREARYEALREAALGTGARAVATAHHEQDQAETVLLHLLRGAGLPGASGMAEQSSLPLPPYDISPETDEPWLWRPFLTESRPQIDEYVASLGLEPVEDPSNQDPGLRRNAIRHQILPALEAAVPGAVAALARFASLAADDDQLLESIAARALAAGVDPGGRLAAAAVRAQPPALQRRLVRRWLLEQADRIELTADRTAAVIALAASGRGGRTVEIGQGWTVRLQRGMLHAERSEVAAKGTRE